MKDNSVTVPLETMPTSPDPVGVLDRIILLSVSLRFRTLNTTTRLKSGPEEIN